MKAHQRWTMADVFMVAVFTGGALLIDWRAGFLSVAHYVYFAPAYLLLAYLAWQGRRADARMLTRSETPPVSSSVSLQRHSAGYWASIALTICGAYTAGWLTKSFNVYLGVFFGTLCVLGAGVQIAAWLRRRDGMMA